MTIYSFHIQKTRVDVGLFNSSYDEETTGVQVALSINGVDNYTGLQVATMNISGDKKGGMKGVQAGYMNFANKLRGVQIGIADVAIKGPCLQIGLFTIRGGDRPWYRQFSPFIGWAGEGDY